MYQSHEGEKATSDSNRKLQRIGLPMNLQGKRVLDIGCCEGFFCAVARERGASRVVGIDIEEGALAFAVNKYGNQGIEFKKLHWRDLPDGPFDIVLWLSAIHYERDPLSIFRKIDRILSRDGLLILECGVVNAPGKVLLPVGRPNDMPSYPTSDFLEDQLRRAGFNFQLAAPGEVTPGDRVPRFVYHCRMRIPTVLIIRGPSRTGKSSFAALLAASSSKVIALDGFIGMLSRNGSQKNPACAFLRENFDANDIEAVCRKLDEAGLTESYVSIIADHVADTDDLVVIEGYLTDLQTVELVRRLRARATVWDATRPEQQRLTRLPRP
jgi:SAM-dependent methyltransferase